MTGADMLRLFTALSKLDKARSLPLTQAVRVGQRPDPVIMGLWVGVSRHWLRLLDMFDLVARVLWALGVPAHEFSPEKHGDKLRRIRNVRELDSKEVRALWDLLVPPVFEHSCPVEIKQGLLTPCQPGVHLFSRRLSKRPFVEVVHVLGLCGVLGKTYWACAMDKEPDVRAKMDKMAVALPRPRKIAGRSQLETAYALLRFGWTHERYERQFPHNTTATPTATPTNTATANNNKEALRSKLRAKQADLRQSRRRG
jgi:hypothetical protein